MESREAEAGTKELERVDLLHRRALKAVNSMIQIIPPNRTPFTIRRREVCLHRVAPHQVNNSQLETQEVLKIVEEAASALFPAVAEGREFFFILLWISPRYEDRKYECCGLWDCYLA